MWSEYVMSQVLEGAPADGRLRPYDSPLSLLYRVMDAGLILLALFAATWFTGVPWSLSMLLAGAMAAALFYFVGLTKHLYRSWRTERMVTEIWKVVEIWLMVAGISLVATYFQQKLLGYPPATMALWLVMAPLPLIAWRVAVRLALRFLRSHGYNTRKLAIAGSGELARLVAHRIKRSPWMGFEIVGLFDDAEAASKPKWEEGVGQRSLDALLELAKNGGVDAVYIALPAGRAELQVEDVVRKLGDSTVSVYMVQDRRSRELHGDFSSHQILPNLQRLDVLHRTYVDLGGIKAVSVYESPFLGPDGWIKRIEDVVVSSIALLLLALPMTIIAIGVKLSGPGPVFFKQLRYGLDGKGIMVWKFRSMTVCENGDKVTQASKNDARITPFGGFLRRTSLDELPQFINVFLGSMSIVGPRPHAISHNEYYRSLVGGYMLRHKVKPGITGWAQINGFRGETETVDKMGRRVDYDLDYIRYWSVWLDLRIIFMTFFRGFVHKNAY